MENRFLKLLVRSFLLSLVTAPLSIYFTNESIEKALVQAFAKMNQQSQGQAQFSVESVKSEIWFSRLSFKNIAIQSGSAKPLTVSKFVIDDFNWWKLYTMLLFKESYTGRLKLEARSIKVPLELLSESQQKFFSAAGFKFLEFSGSLQFSLEKPQEMNLQLTQVQWQGVGIAGIEVNLENFKNPTVIELITALQSPDYRVELLDQLSMSQLKMVNLSYLDMGGVDRANYVAYSLFKQNFKLQLQATLQTQARMPANIVERPYYEAYHDFLAQPKEAKVRLRLRNSETIEQLLQSPIFKSKSLASVLDFFVINVEVNNKTY